MQEFMLFAQEEAWWIGGGFVLFWVVLAIAALVFWIWALVDAIKNTNLDDTMRIVWVIVIVFTQLLGALLYLIVGRSMARRTPG